MADYYSLLSRAVAALPQSAPESRQAVYERARKALFKQLRSIQPPVAEEDIEAEGRALDEAIARVELETVRAAAETVAGERPAVVERPPTTERPLTVERMEAPAAPPPPAPPHAPAPAPRATDAVPPPAAPAKEPMRPTPAAAERKPPEASAETPPREEGPTPPQRPAAPLPSLPEPASNSRRILVIAGVLAAVVALVALLAWQFRERPEDLARLKPEPQSAEEEPSENGKLADRVDGGESTPPAEAPKSNDRAPQKGQPVAVAQKAELWVAAPEEASKVKTFPGTVIWRLESMPAGAGQTLTPAIRGDIDIPGAGLKASLVIQKNLDATLSASHTINVSFDTAGGEIKSVKTIAPLQMRRPEAQSGEQVAGVLVPITENNFLIGLMPGTREARNVTLLRAPLIIDLPMQLDNGRAATISLEKGPSGERVFLDALDAWAGK
jgi:hypothetical protein